jgi:hypothetical protein
MPSWYDGWYGRERRRGKAAAQLTTSVTRKAMIAPQWVGGALSCAVAGAGPWTRQGYLAEVSAAVPGRSASNAAPVTPICSITGSTLGLRTAELVRTGVHLAAGVPRSRTRIAVPVRTQKVLPLSAVVTVSTPPASGRAQAGGEPGGAGAVGVEVAAADAVAVAVLPEAAAGRLGCPHPVTASAHPATASAPMAAAAAERIALGMPVSLLTCPAAPARRRSGL